MPGPRAPEQQRREQILEAALRVAVRDRLEAMTMSAVAVEAGLSKGLVFFHFGTKDALLVALLDHLVDWLVDLPVEDDAVPVVQRLLGQLAGEGGYSGANRERIDLLLQFAVLAVRRPELRERAVTALRRYRGVLRRPAEDLLRDAGVQGAGGHGPGVAALAASVVIGAALQSFVDEEFSPQEIVPGLRTLVALPRPPAQPG